MSRLNFLRKIKTHKYFSMEVWEKTEELRGQMALSLEGPVVSKTPGIHK